MTPILKEIDLSKGNGHEHPDIKLDNTTYLAKIGGHYSVGTFFEQWFGLSFNDNFCNPQFDAPGFNKSDWENLWEIIDDEQSLKKDERKNKLVDLALVADDFGEFFNFNDDDF